MKNTFLLLILLCISVTGFSQTVPNLPIPLAFGSAEVWGDSIYHFGGSNNYNGNIVYPRIYKYNGTVWSYYDTIPFNHVWGLATAKKGDSVFVFGGYPGGQNALYLYRLSTKSWQSLANATSGTFNAYGHSLEYLNGTVYGFYNGYVGRYSIQSNSWSLGTTLNKSASWSSTTIFNGEIYVAGWGLGEFYKYTPQTDQWTQLQALPRFTSGGALRTVDDKIYLIGGSSTFSAGSFTEVLVYDPATNQWVTDSRVISSQRAYMLDVIHKNGLFVMGGVDVNAQAVNTVEFIINQTPAQTANLIYDDGDPQSSYYWPGNGQGSANRMTPTLNNAVLTQMEIYFTGVNSGTATYKPIVLSNNGGQPGTSLVNLNFKTAINTPAWDVTDLSGYNIIVNGDFFVGLTYDGTNQPLYGYDPIDNGRAWDFDGSAWSSWNETYFIRATIQTLTSVAEISNEIPDKFELSFNYPNPFNPSTKFRYALPEGRNVKITVYDINGARVTELVNNFQNAGTYEVTWNGKNDLNQQVASGTYIYSVIAGDFVQNKKMVLLK